MYRNIPSISQPKRYSARATAYAAALLGLASSLAAAQTLPAATVASPPVTAAASKQKPFSLQEAFDAAWSRQPEAQSLAAREEAGAARREAASSLTAEPAALELLGKTDRLNRNQGSREYEVGIALPLWLPGERSRSMAFADAEMQAIAAKAAAARLRVAASVREAYWSWQRARVEFALSRDRVAAARTLAADVARRVRAGDLARADQHQAEGNLAAAESALAENGAALVKTRQQIRQLTGLQPQPESTANADVDHQREALPRLTAAESGSLNDTHAEIADPAAQAEAARMASELARIQTRQNPELVLSTTRDRGDFASPYQQTITAGLRIPFGSGARYRAKDATARADALEAESQLRLARERVAAEFEAARQRVESALVMAAAANKRAQLARESRGFFEKSFRSGETDLPTRLRIELEATEAERQAQRARIEHAASISALRQALGLLPE